MAEIKAEFRKLVTIRSTYITLGISLLLEIFFAFYIGGIRLSAADVHNPNLLSGDVIGAMSVVGLLIALVAVLLVTHEYRYNTIMYTLTASKSRTRILLAKVVVMSCFAIIFSLIFGFLSPVLSILGIHLHGLHLDHQIFPTTSLLWRVAFMGWGFTMLALILATLIRIQVGAIAALFLLPGTVEQLLGLLLKQNKVYLPFSVLNQVLDPRDISAKRAAAVGGIYIVGGFIAVWIFFLRRDAN